MRGPATIGPYDEAYHWKRIAYSARHFPRVLAFDPDREAWCPWPPLYDVTMAAIAHVIPSGARDLGGGRYVSAPHPPGSLAPLGMTCVLWVPPIAFSLFAAIVGVTYGWVAGAGIALAPYLIGVSSIAKIDHHWTEPMFVVAMLALRRRPIALGVVMAAALFVQPALIIACGLLFFVCDRSNARSFALAALAVIVYRMSSAYPDNGWFLGWPHAALLAAAAVALILKPRWYAIPIGAAVALPWLPQIAAGMHFLRGDPWLQSIVEFQPLFHDWSRVGTDLANVSGGVVALVIFARKRSPALLLFSIAYLALALSSQRFLVPAMAVFALAGATAAIERPVLAALLTLLPPLCYDLYALTHPQPAFDPVTPIAQRIAALPPGRVLAPWYMGHAIDVIGHHAVVIDNFGTMPDSTRFELANEALDNPRIVRAYCRMNHVRYVVMHGAIWTME